VVQGDPEHNIPQDPEEIPSPAVMLEGLAAELAENLARGVFAELVAQREDLYKKALERIEARSFDVATENLVLFLYAQQGKEDILFKKAALLLEQLTGCNLPALWVRSR
jgi:hypothetical protein